MRMTGHAKIRLLQKPNHLYSKTEWKRKRGRDTGETTRLTRSAPLELGSSLWNAMRSCWPPAWISDHIRDRLWFRASIKLRGGGKGVRRIRPVDGVDLMDLRWLGGWCSASLGSAFSNKHSGCRMLRAAQDREKIVEADSVARTLNIDSAPRKSPNASPFFPDFWYPAIGSKTKSLIPSRIIHRKRKDEKWGSRGREDSILKVDSTMRCKQGEKWKKRERTWETKKKNSSPSFTTWQTNESADSGNPRKNGDSLIME